MESLTWQSAVKPSRYFAVLLLTLHLGSVLVVYLTSIILIAKSVMWLLIASSLCYHMMRDVGLRLPFSWREISLTQNEVTIVTQDGSKLTGLLSDKSVVFGGFVILLVKLEGRYFTVARVIFRDALTPEIFRQLCVYLRLSNPDSIVARSQ